MKFAAAFMLLIWGTLIVQPSFAYFGGKAAYGECSQAVPKTKDSSKARSAGSTCVKKKVKKGACSRQKCDNPSNPRTDDKCQSQGCNPSLGCSSGNFYVHHHQLIAIPSWLEQKQEAEVSNDNRIVKTMSECWHPPEA